MRIPRKSKKWHKKHGYQIHYMPHGEVYFTRTFRIILAKP